MLGNVVVPVQSGAARGHASGCPHRVPPPQTREGGGGAGECGGRAAGHRQGQRGDPEPGTRPGARPRQGGPAGRASAELSAGKAVPGPRPAVAGV